MAETSLLFNLIAKDKATAAVERMKERFASASAALGTGVATALGYGVAQSLDMGAASSKLAAQLGVGPAKAAELSKVASATFKAGWGDSFDTVNTAIRGVVQNLGDVSKEAGGLQGVTQKVLALSQTFDLDLGQATAAIGNMIKTGLVKNASEGVDLTAVAFKKLGTTGDDFLDTMREYSVQFKKAGMTGPKALGLINQMLQAGAPSSDMAADAIKEFALEAGQGSQKIKDGLKGIGLDAGQMLKMLGQGGSTADKAFSTILGSLKKIEDPLKRNEMAVALFGTKAEDLADSLFAMDPSKAVQSLGQISGAADKMAKTLSDNPKAALEKFKREAQLQLAEIGGGIVQWAMQNQGMVKPLGIALGVVAAAMVTVRVAQAAWTTVQVTATAAQWAWNAAMSANPIALIIIGVVALVGVVVLLWKRNETFRRVVTAAWQAVWGVIKAVGGWFATTLWPWMKSAYSKISSGAVGVWTAVSTWWGRMLAWVKALPGRIGKFFGNAGKILWSKGKDIVVGLWNGLVSMHGWIVAKVRSWIRTVIPDPIAKVLSISSPSKVTEAQGRWIAKGLVKGLTGGGSEVKSAAKKLADLVTGAMKPSSRRSALLDRVKGDTAMLGILAGQQAYFSKQLEKANERLDNLRKARADLINSVRDSIVSGASIVSSGGEEPPTSKGILDKLKADADAARKFADDLEKLRKKGLDKDLVADLASKGVEGAGATAAALAGASGADIKAINQQQKTLEYHAKRAGTVAGDAMYAAGIKAAEGMVKGLEKEEKKVAAAMLRIAKALQKAIKKALGIKSPSAVMAEVGRWIPPGLVSGVQAASPAMETRLRRWASEAIPSAIQTPQARPAAPLTPIYAGGAAAIPMVVRLVIDVTGAGEEVKRLIRKIVRVDGRGNVQVAFGSR